ncbi:MAG: PAS domain S-box protein, partial [Burkholderiaceae bacterium]
MISFFVGMGVAFALFGMVVLARNVIRRTKANGLSGAQPDEAIGSELSDLREPEELIETRAHLQLVVDSMFDGLITLDEHGTVLSMNHMARKISGYGDLDLTGLQSEQLLGDVMARRGEFVDPAEARMLTSKGQSIPVELAIRVVSTAKRGKLSLLTIRDLSEVKNAQKTLKQQSQIIDESESFVFVVNQNRSVEWCNKRFEVLTGYSLPELEEMGSMQAIFRQTNTPTEHQAMERHESFKTETLLRSKTGRPYWVLLNWVPLHDEDGEFEKYAGLGFDITDRKVADQMQSEFVSMVSHELRTPLTVIAGALDAFQLDPNCRTPETEAMLIEMGQRNCARLETLIENLLDISKIENGTLSFQYQNIDVVEVIHGCVNDSLTIAERSGISLNLEIAPTDLFAFADRVRLGQVLSNLLSNAIKFSAEGTEVSVRVVQEQERVLVSVRDAGRGIAEEF